MKPAASQIGTPDWASQVAQVWRSVCGTTSDPRPAALRAERKALLILLTGSRFHSTMVLETNPSRIHRRRWTSKREGSLTGGWRFLVSFQPAGRPHGLGLSNSDLLLVP